MLTNKTTSWIVLERGVEDDALISEIREFERLMFSYGTDPYVKFPSIVALRQALEDNLTEEE